MADELEGRKIAILATDGVEQFELTDPWHALEAAGAEVDLVSIKSDSIQGVRHQEKADTFPVDCLVTEASASDYDALVLPGGVANPDRLRTDPAAVQFVREFFAEAKPVASICHGPWMLVEADVVRHRTLTSWPSLRTDIRNAGGTWVDEVVHADQGLVTSRKPDDLPAFCARMVQEFGRASGARARQATGRPRASKAAPGDQDTAVEVSSEDSFPASDSPSSLRVT